MPVFEKGNPGKPVGAKCKATKTLKEFLNVFTEENQEEIAAAFSRLDDKDKISAWIAMVKFVMPSKVQMEVAPVTQIPDEYQNLDYETLCEIEEIVKRKRIA